jgi:hypothetical protein
VVIRLRVISWWRGVLGMCGKIGVEIELFQK